MISFDVIILCISITAAVMFLLLRLLLVAVKISFLLIRMLIVLAVKLTARIRRKKENKKHLKRACSGCTYGEGAGSCFKGSERLNGMAAEEIGAVGERQLLEKLSSLSMEKYIADDLYVPDRFGRTCQIDAVLINPYGIHVIEYKNYTCDIFIPKNVNEEWTRYSYKGTSPYSVYSPVRQNERHADVLYEALSHLSGMRGMEKCIFTYVVMGDGCAIHTFSDNNKCRIMNLSDITDSTFESAFYISCFTMAFLNIMLQRYENAPQNVREKHRQYAVNCARA